MLGSDDLTTRILIEIRDRLDQTNARLDKVNDNLGARIDGLARTLDLKVEGVDSKIERVHQQLVESDMREGMRHVDFVASNAAERHQLAQLALRGHHQITVNDGAVGLFFGV